MLGLNVTYGDRMLENVRIFRKSENLQCRNVGKLSLVVLNKIAVLISASCSLLIEPIAMHDKCNLAIIRP